MNFIIDSLKKYNPLYNLAGTKKLGFGADLSLDLFGTEDLPRNVTAQQQRADMEAEQRAEVKEIDTQTEPIASRPVFGFLTREQEQKDRALAARFNQPKKPGGGGSTPEFRFQNQQDRALAARINQPKKPGGGRSTPEFRFEDQRARELAARINRPKTGDIAITTVPASEIRQLSTKVENLSRPTVGELLQTDVPTIIREESMPETRIRASEPLLEEQNLKKTKTASDEELQRRLDALREPPKKALPNPPLKTNPNPNIVKTQSGAIALGPQEIKQETGLPFAAPASVQPVVQAPVVQQPAPVVQQTAPAPVVQQTAPVVQQPAPVVQQPAPVVQQPAPVVQQPAPVVQQPAPSLSMEQLKQYVDEQISSNYPPPPLEEEEMKEKETRENPFLENPQKQKRKKATVEQQFISLNPSEVEFISEKETKQPQFNIDVPKKITPIKSSAPLLPNAPKTLPKVFLQTENNPEFVDQLLSKFRNHDNPRNIQLASDITKNFEQKDIEEAIKETGQPTTQKELDKLKNILGKRKKKLPLKMMKEPSIGKQKGTTRDYPRREKKYLKIPAVQQPAPIQIPQNIVDS